MKLTANGETGWDCYVHAIGKRFLSAKEAIEYFYSQDKN